MSLLCSQASPRHFTRLPLPLWNEGLAFSLLFSTGFLCTTCFLQMFDSVFLEIMVCKNGTVLDLLVVSFYCQIWSLHFLKMLTYVFLEIIACRDGVSLHLLCLKFHFISKFEVWIPLMWCWKHHIDCEFLPRIEQCCGNLEGEWNPQPPLNLHHQPKHTFQKGLVVTQHQC